MTSPAPLCYTLSMIIDIHTHIFPDHLAPRALAKLREESGDIYPLAGEGTAAGLVRDMNGRGVDAAVSQPVVTRPSQLRAVNEWAASTASGRIIPFGGIYPRSGNYKADIDEIVRLGLKGLKFHAEYQDFVVDDPHMLRVYDYALSKGLVLLHHGGYDPAFRPPFRSSPRQFANVAKAMRGGVLIVAHLGGHAQWDDVERYLVGGRLYLDTSMGFEFYRHDQFLRIVEAHGADKILFGSDYPWSDAAKEIAILRSLPLSGAEKAAILGGNARRILGI